jgi:hypothetical protein
VVATQFYKRRHDPWSWAQYPLSCRCELRSCLVLCDATPRADWWAALEVLEVKRDFRAVPFMLTGASSTGVALPTPSKPTNCNYDHTAARTSGDKRIISSIAPLCRAALLGRAVAFSFATKYALLSRTTLVIRGRTAASTATRAFLAYSLHFAP